MNVFKKATSLLLSFLLAFGLFSDLTVSAAENFEDSAYDSGKMFGYVPPPFDTSNLLYGGAAGLHETLRASDIPSKYCLFKDSGNTVDEITPELKDQDGWGVCWAFGSLGSAESSLYQNGSNDLDFSERHLAYFTYNGTNNPDKPEDGTQGDSFLANMAAYGDSAPFQTGGNFYKSIATLSRGVGVEMEENVSYPTEDDFLENNAKYFNHVDEKYHFASHYQLREANILPNKNAGGSLNGSEIKKALMGGNSVGLSYCADTASYNLVEGVKYPTYFNGTKYFSNHAVQVVGWDDSIASASFTDKNGIHPSMDGGWLIKNTWGKQNADRGGTYFYLSYEDQTISMLCSLIMDKTPQDSPRYAHNYQYDGDGQTATIGDLGQWGRMANIFTATGNQTLEAVAFYTTGPDANYSIQVYTDLTDSDSPVDGTKVFTEEQSGSQAYAGYHTVDLDQPVPLKNGEKFSVVITTLSQNALPVALETNSSGYSKAGISKGQSFFNGGTFWQDLTTVATSGNVCIKAFTNDQSAQPSITLTPPSASVTKGQSQQFTALVSGIEDKTVSGRYQAGKVPIRLSERTERLRSVRMKPLQL
jgi:C1A family cysteine protease